MQELRGWTRSTEYDAHVEWWLRAKEDLTNTKMFESGFMSSTGLTAGEHASLQTMLSSRGVQEFPPGMLQEMKTCNEGSWSFSRSLTAEISTTRQSWQSALRRYKAARQAENTSYRDAGKEKESMRRCASAILGC